MQHKTLIKMVNDLHDAMVAGHGKEVLQPTLEKLASYTVNHFAHEERFMKAAGYPGYPGHKHKHDELAAKATSIISDYKAGKLVLGLALAQFLADWVAHHIQGEDKAMVTWLKAHKGTAVHAPH